HTRSHCHLTKSSESEAHEEIAASRERIAREIGLPVRHFAYPYGDRPAADNREFALTRALGFETAVTTRPGMLFPEHAGHLWALPRLSLNGNYQTERMLAVVASGAA